MKTQQQAEESLCLKLRQNVTFLPFIYESKSQIIDFNCSLHGDFKQRIDVAKRTGGCQKCGKLIADTIHLIDFDEFKRRSFEKYGNTVDFSNVIYNGYRNPIILNCVIHGEYETTPYLHLRTMNGCQECGNFIRKQPKKTFQDFIEKAKEKHGNKYIYHESDFVNYSQEMKITCKDHGFFLMKPKSHLQGYGCKTCGYDKVASVNNLTTEDFIKKSIEKHGNKYDYSKSVYTKARNKIIITCKEHGDFKQNAYAHMAGNGCKKCYATISKPETEVANFISQFVEIETNTRKVIPPKELDIFIPSKNLAVEFNGTAWHSEKFTKDKMRHQRKHLLCAEKNIRLIQIWQDDWELKNDLVKSMIMAALGIFDKVIYARNCLAKTISGSEAKYFLNANHLNGFRTSQKHVGLYFENELVMVASFSKPSVFIKKATEELELTRFASKQGYRIIGGLGKLLKCVEFSSLLSFADALWYSGKSYQANGFELIGLTKPGYSYVDFKTWNRKHRFSFTKAKIKEKFSNYDESLSEEQNMSNNNFWRLYDAGHYKYVLKR